MKHTVVCAWCGKLMSEGTSSEISHGMCARCVGTTEGLAVEDLHEIAAEDLDCLPIGVVRVTKEGVISAYNSNESERFGYKAEEVLGRNFFTDVAPCTSVRVFQGRFEEMVLSGESGRAELDFVFCTDSWSKLVQVVLVWDAGQQQGTLLISTPL